MSGADYHAAPGVSKSRLDAFAEKSPLHYWDRFINPDRLPEERTEAKMLGDAVHAAIGEPDTIGSRFVVVPEDAPKRPTKTQLNAAKPSLESQGAIQYWKEFLAEHDGKTILKPEQMATVIACRDACWLDPYVAGLLEGARFEQTYYAIDPETGALIKCRLDADRLEDGLILDFKTTEDASPDEFWRSAKKYRYGVQDAWYSDVVDRAVGVPVAEQFAFIAIEKKRPNGVGVYFYPPEEVAAARQIARANLRDIAHYTNTYGDQKWPTYTEHGAQKLQSKWDRDRNN
jgi:exodeoxyribonuclease VIII